MSVIVKGMEMPKEESITIQILPSGAVYLEDKLVYEACAVEIPTPHGRLDRILQVTKNRLNGMTDYSGIPLWYDTPSKRILEARGMNRERFGWNIEDGFLQVPEMGEEVEIEF